MKCLDLERGRLFEADAVKFSPFSQSSNFILEQNIDKNKSHKDVPKQQITLKLRGKFQHSHGLSDNW